MRRRVQRASAAGRGGTDLATRLRVQRLLAGASLEPDDLPPSAILLVRSLPDPLPGRLRPHRAAVRAPPDWERAVRGALAERLRAAARPVHGVVPADAGSVLFADQAESLAAFARDAAAGVAARCWWWAALLRGLPGGDLARLAALWTRDARYVPAALEHLALWGEAERVLAALPVDQVTRILAAVARACDVPALLAAPPGRLRHPPSLTEPQRSAHAERDNPSGTIRGAVEEARDAAPGPSPAPPWERVVPPTLVRYTLGPERRALLGAALALHRAPLVARSPAFAEAFVRWRAAAAPVAAPPRPSRPEPTARPTTGPADAAPPPAPHQGEAAADREFARELPQLRDRPSPAAPHRRAPATDAAGRIGSSQDSEAASAPERSHSVARPDDPGRKQSEREPAEGADVQGVTPGTRNPAEEPARHAGPMQWRLPSLEPEQTHSGLCGVFYLVNVVRGLGYFRALDAHFRLPPVVGGWGWIELLARCLLHPSASAADDPIWRVLAGLDGRESDEPAGSGFVGTEVATLPETWARLVMEAGPSPEIPPDPPFAKGGTREVGTRRKGQPGTEGKSPFEKGGFRGIRRPGGEGPLHRFLDLVVPFVRLRLEATLRAAGADEPLETAMFRRVGLVQVTSSHVDVRMTLDQVTLPVRLAGLDASPGWVPELGRVVTFHFQERTS
jgi:hypothetical protein